ncbi:STM4015 family protein [Paenibacillus sp. MMS20-IR301]|uniref:STM4015 family protein n=1 Tax=Paenibacillus sp. MMS20-IR301 TaxID=2895946 RepID=UPI0028E32814|nr:STM4015 family protein [Paenibacillus sp. MMS20-IR301]WNS41181.1 STM4015 family protein [Paenibacillus sp. MMS20-IR301]
MTVVKLSIGYDEFEEGKRIVEEIERLSSSPEAGELTSLTIGDWGQAYETSSEEVVQALVKHSASFPALRSLFIGEMSYEECEISWINQTDLSPLLPAYPELQSLTIQGGTDLRLSGLQHDKLEELIIITGGLSRNVLADIAAAALPNLQKLELYLGVDEYGFDGGLEDLLPLIEPGKFPKLTYLGLKNSEIQDEIAAALADAPILDQLETLDLSLGTLSDTGAEALLASGRIQGLKLLNLSRHYMSDEMMLRLKNSGLPADVSDQQTSDDEDDWRYPSITE